MTPSLTDETRSMLVVLAAKPKKRPDGTVAKTTLVPDGGGLYLQLSASGDTISKSWIFRSSVGGRETRMGLGVYPSVSLSEARDKAAVCRSDSRTGVNPLAAKRQRAVEEERAERERKAAEALANARGVTFKDAAEQYIRGKQAGWSSAAYRAQWTQSLEDYAFPIFGDLPCADVTPELVLQALEPHWEARTKTMKDARGRIAAVLNFAAVKGYRPRGQNPAAWRDNLEVSLAKPSLVTPVINHPALPHAQIPEFMARVRAEESTKARALEMVVLCASRVSEVIGARWSEFNLTDRLWTIPASRMKTREEHNVPLSDAAIAVLMAVRGDAIPHPNNLVFPNPRGMKWQKTDILKVARKIWPDMINTPEGPRAITVHGLRSSFRDWVGEEDTGHAGEVAEHALAHVVKGVEGDYRRGKALKKRRRLMADWAAFCASQPVHERHAAS